MGRSSIDLNADLGESYGVYRIGQDEAIVPWVSSANIACGFHAGDAATMRRTVRLCAEQGTAIGAHPGLPDLAGFGRRPMAITPEEAYELMLYQCGALLAFVRAEGVELRHVKPHGALYNQAAGDRALADAIARAVYRLDSSLYLYGLAGSELVAAGEAVGLRTMSEAFADRSYLPDGTLTPRTEPGAVIHDVEESVRVVIRMVQEGIVLTRSGEAVPMRADTVCIHGDGPDAPARARRIREQLENAGIAVRAPEPL